MKQYRMVKAESSNRERKIEATMYDQKPMSKAHTYGSFTYG
jgi:hypothetical protein